MSGCSRLTRRRFRRDPLTLSSPTKATPFPIILWRCWAAIEHGITQPRPHDLRWVVRRAAGLKGQLSRSNTLSSGRRVNGSPGERARVRGVRLLRLTCHAAAGPAQPEMTRSGPRSELEVGLFSAPFLAQ